MLLALLLVNVLLVECNIRQKRYLVYPDGGPARAQFIIGLGVPVDLKEASVTVGTVIKFQYDLPTNSSEYTTRIYGFAETVSRDIDEKPVNDLVSTDTQDLNSAKGRLQENDYEADTDLDDKDGNNTLVNISFEERRKRALYSEGGVLNDVDNTVSNTEIPLQEAIKKQEKIDYTYVDDNEPQRMNRWDFYKIIEHMVERYGYTGRPCLLRTICEAASVPFTHENGLLGEIGHIMFTPSTTKDAVSHHTDNEYHAAERLGREIDVDCENLFSECEDSILDTFTHIGIDTLHKFGLY